MPVVMNTPLVVEFHIRGNRPLSSEDLFKLAEALDAYEIELGVKDRLVIDMAELDISGIIVVTVVPKDMLPYEEVHRHIHLLMEQAIARADLHGFTHRLKRVTFHPVAPGVPSRQLDNIEDLKRKVERLWEEKYGEQMKSYA